VPRASWDGRHWALRAGVRVARVYCRRCRRRAGPTLGDGDWRKQERAKEKSSFAPHADVRICTCVLESERKVGWWVG
jgi:hypothetical protein